MSHKYSVSMDWCWYNPSEPGSSKYIVKMYFIEGYPYTFDDIPEISIWDPTLIANANKHQNGKIYTPAELHRSSSYLIMEEVHPCLFPVLVDRPELVPKD